MRADGLLLVDVASAVKNLNSITEFCALGILRATNDDELSFARQYGNLHVVELGLTSLLRASISMFIHQEKLTALDEGILVFDLTHVLEVVAVLRHAHTEEAATLR